MRRRARHRPEGQGIARTCLELNLTSSACGCRSGRVRTIFASMRIGNFWLVPRVWLRAIAIAKCHLFGDSDGNMTLENGVLAHR